MPSHLTPSWSRPGPRRRSLLTGAAGAAGTALLAGCSGASGPDADERPSAARRLRGRAVQDSTELLARYDAVLAAHPGLRARLAPLRAEVARHKAAFAEGLPEATPSSGPAGPSASPSTGASPVPSVPGDEKAAARGLAAAERELSDRRGTALLDAPPELARLLASVAAAGAAHAYLLTEGAK
ncbi:hypothetical protein ACQB60_41330 [Actinomycetota bacterium Odt1-20B]